MAKNAKAKPAKASAPTGKTHLENLQDLPIKDIIPTDDCPRRIDEKSEKFLELLGSIRGVGVQVPVQVRKHATKSGKYDLRAGKRRLRASEILGIKTIPAIVISGMDDAAAFDLTLSENKGRDDLTPLEEGELLRKCLELHRGDAKAVAAKLDWSPRKVRLVSRLKALAPCWRKAIDAGELDGWTSEHLGLVARYDAKVQEEILKDFEYGDEVPTVAALEKKLEGDARALRSAKFSVTADNLTSAGSCLKCRKRSCYLPGLFDDEMGVEAPVTLEIPKNDRCLDRQCYETKLEAFVKGKLEEARKQNPKIVRVAAEGYTGDRGIVDKYGWKPAKKGAKGAVEALVVSGPDAGAVKMVTLNRIDNGDGRTVATAGPKTMEQKREALEAKREAWIRERILHRLSTDPDKDIEFEEHMKDSGSADPDDAFAGLPALAQPNQKSIMALACAFGAFPAPTDEGGESSVEQRWGAALVHDEARLLSDLWSGIREAITDKYQPAEFPEDAGVLAEVCAAMGIDYDDLEKKAEARFLEPKSWAKEDEERGAK